jgi:signal transduction histidine kinase
MAQLDEDTPAALVLGRPLDRWRLLVNDAAVPTRAVLRRNAWLYPVSLAVLVGLVLVGTFVTLGSASREIRLSRLQTDFVSSVSHELRTPLTSIQLFVETLQSGRLDDDPQKVQECLSLLSLETDRLSRMIERTLDWARMEAGRRVYDMEPVRVRELVDESLQALRSQHLLGEAVDAVEVAEVPEGLYVTGDQDALVEALLNLLQNAIRYTAPPRRIRLEVRPDGGWVGLAVHDNGPGIAPRDRRRIFEKFYQADTFLSRSTQKGADRGSGLGLSIVRAVARGHRGRVELDSEVGKGSTFTLWVRRPGHSAMGSET